MSQPRRDKDSRLKANWPIENDDVFLSIKLSQLLSFKLAENL